MSVQVKTKILYQSTNLKSVTETLGDSLNKPRQHSFIFKLSLGNKLTYTQTHNKGLQMKATLFTAFVLTT